MGQGDSVYLRLQWAGGGVVCIPECIMAGKGVYPRMHYGRKRDWCVSQHEIGQAGGGLVV